MKPGDFIAIAIIVVIIGLAVLYIYRAKKSGKKCIGCPYSGSCGGNCCSAHVAEADDADEAVAEQTPADEQKPEASKGVCNGNCAGCSCCGGKNTR